MHESYLFTIKDIQFMDNDQVLVIAVGIRNYVWGIALQLKKESIAQYFLQNKNSHTPS